MSDSKIDQPQTVEPDSLTSKEAIDFGKDVAKDVSKQALVWVLAGFLTKGIRDVVGKVIKK